MKKDDGRMQAYGWSLPAKFTPPTAKGSSSQSNKSSVPVPVPVYCRPLLEQDSGMKVNLNSYRYNDVTFVTVYPVYYKKNYQVFGY